MAQSMGRDYDKSFSKLGHVKSPGKVVDMSNSMPTEPKRQSYSSLPRFMANNTYRNGINFTSEKSLADVISENWAFYEPPSSFKLMTNSEISKKTAELKHIMQERNQLAIARKLEAIDPLDKSKGKTKRVPIWDRKPSKNSTATTNAGVAGKQDAGKATDAS